MAQVYFVGDLHLGHRAIMRHTAETPGAKRGPQEFMLDPVNPYAVDAHDSWVIEQLLSVPSDKRTLWWILGDVCMEMKKLRLVDNLPGRKRLVLGNHDLFNTQVYLKHFESVYGPIYKYGLWLSHIPVHEEELRGRNNVHGHCHHNNLADDPRYLNTALEWLPDNKPLSLEQVREYFARGMSEI